MSNGRPFALPEDVGLKRTRAATYLYPAASAHIRAHIKNNEPERVAKDMFVDDKVTPIVVRAASSAATTGSPTWASALAQQVVDDSVMAIATLSAAAGLIQRGMKIDFARRASIRIPGRILDANDILPVPSQNLTQGRNRGGFCPMSGRNHQACPSG